METFPKCSKCTTGTLLPIDERVSLGYEQPTAELVNWLHGVYSMNEGSAWIREHLARFGIARKWKCTSCEAEIK